MPPCEKACKQPTCWPQIRCWSLTFPPCTTGVWLGPWLQSEVPWLSLSTVWQFSLPRSGPALVVPRGALIPPVNHGHCALCILQDSSEVDLGGKTEPLRKKQKAGMGFPLQPGRFLTSDLSWGAQLPRALLSPCVKRILICLVSLRETFQRLHELIDVRISGKF